MRYLNAIRSRPSIVRNNGDKNNMPYEKNALVRCNTLYNKYIALALNMAAGRKFVVFPESEGTF